MQFTQAKQYPNWKAGPAEDPAIGAQKLDAVMASRPLKPPPFQFAPRRLSAATVEARRDSERAAGGRLMTTRLGDYGGHDHDHDGAELAIVQPRTAASGLSNATGARTHREAREAA